jgi:hypothetical protein
MPEYSLEKFEADMKQLGGMIESFYSQDGGKPSSDASSHEVGHKMKNSDGKTFKVKMIKGEKKWVYVRTFKVVSVNGKKYESEGRYKGAEPKNAAKKAFLKICKKMNMNKNSCKLTFTLQECTSGSDKRVYGPYEGSREKLPKTRVKKFQGRKIVQTHMSVVKKVKK